MSDILRASATRAIFVAGVETERCGASDHRATSAFRPDGAAGQCGCHMQLPRHVHYPIWHTGRAWAKQWSAAQERLRALRT